MGINALVLHFDLQNLEEEKQHLFILLPKFSIDPVRSGPFKNLRALRNLWCNFLSLLRKGSVCGLLHMLSHIHHTYTLTEISYLLAETFLLGELWTIFLITSKDKPVFCFYFCRVWILLKDKPVFCFYSCWVGVKVYLLPSILFSS